MVPTSKTDVVSELNESFVESREVRKSFGRLEVLKGVNMSIARGEVAVLLGPSGSGKSTFLRCINKIETIDSGRIWFDGKLIGIEQRAGRLYEMKSQEVAKQRRDIGMVFQRFNLFAHMTALQNVMHAPLLLKRGKKAAIKARAYALLESVGLGDKTDNFPSQLSGGQQQRVAIARALAMEPKLMLFDEPTSALDPELVGDVLEVIRGLANTGMTMLIVTHEIGFAREIADTAYFMDDGKVVESGAPDTLFSKPREDRTKMFLSKVL